VTLWKICRAALSWFHRTNDTVTSPTRTARWAPRCPVCPRPRPLRSPVGTTTAAAITPRFRHHPAEVTLIPTPCGGPGDSPQVSNRCFFYIIFKSAFYRVLNHKIIHT
jgi:hypothetical protein